MKSEKFLRWSILYSLIMIIAIYTHSQSTSLFTKIPALLIMITAWIIMVKFFILDRKHEKKRKAEVIEREIQEQERQQRIKSYYRK